MPPTRHTASAQLCAPLAPSAPLASSRRHGCVVREVCKRWEHVYYSSSCADLWREYGWKFSRQELEDERRMAAGLQFFQRIGPLIEGIIFEGEPEQRWRQAAAEHLPAFLNTLSSTMLTRLGVRHLPLTAAAMHTIAQFRRLKVLGIMQDGPSACPGGITAAIGQLKHLQNIQFGASSVEGALLAALCRLPQLAVLDLESKDRPLPNLEGLTALAGSLTSLILWERDSEGGGLKLPSVALFPKLERLFVAAPRLKVSSCLLLVKGLLHGNLLYLVSSQCFPFAHLQVPGGGCLVAINDEGSWEPEAEEWEEDD